VLTGAAAVCLSAVIAAGGRAAEPPAPAPAGAADAAAPIAHAAATRTVVLKNIAFSPRTVTVKRGGKVTWSWQDHGITHNVTGRGFSSGNRSKGRFSVTFKKAGTFSYRCTIHPGMTGKVVVKR
jgi:plastocyanin